MQGPPSALRAASVRGNHPCPLSLWGLWGAGGLSNFPCPPPRSWPERQRLGGSGEGHVPGPGREGVRLYFFQLKKPVFDTFDRIDYLPSGANSPAQNKSTRFPFCFPFCSRRHHKRFNSCQSRGSCKMSPAVNPPESSGGSGFQVPSLHQHKAHTRVLRWRERTCGRSLQVDARHALRTPSACVGWLGF